MSVAEHEQALSKAASAGQKGRGLSIILGAKDKFTLLRLGSLSFFDGVSEVHRAIFIKGGDGMVWFEKCFFLHDFFSFGMIFFLLFFGRMRHDFFRKIREIIHKFVQMSVIMD